jgi:ubiquinone/menaquinone biosynthesis C-methylase UbiE
MPDLDPDVRAYYERGYEIDRFSLKYPSGPLEFERTKELLARFLPSPPLGILDVGGGPGAYAAWLADRGYTVHLVDPVALHVEQARAAHTKITAEIGDARQLSQSGASVDAVLLFGPLYHLVDRPDRIRALAEARRVLRPGGWLFAAAISRYAALLDLLVRAGRLYEPGVLPVVRESVNTGVFHGTHNDLFTTAYFHSPAGLGAEITEAGFQLRAVLGIEGPGFMLRDFEAVWTDPSKRDAIMETARLLEDRPEMLAVSAHLLAVARI